MKKKLIILSIIFCFAFAVGAAAGDTGEFFFKNNISGDTRLIDMYMLGAHDAFTASLNENSPVDAAGVLLDDGAKWSENDMLWKLISLPASKAQSDGVEAMLNKGVRYFDVRLSRYQNGGEYYTCHGRISDQFTGEGGVARKIAAWAAKHPGEIIILDFQSLFNIQSPNNGHATADSWKTLATKLEADGIMSYVYTRNGSVSAHTYDSLTNKGSRCAIVVFGQVTGADADNRFINRNDDSGYIRSNWANKSSYDAVQTAIRNEVSTLKTDSDKYFYKLRVMQAQSTGNVLVDAANKENIKALNSEEFDGFNEILPILMVDNATTDSGNFNALAVEKLARKNRAFTDGVYSATDGNVTLTGSNELVPLNTAFSARLSGEALTLALTDGADIEGEMTLLIKAEGKKQQLFKDGDLLAETDKNGWLKANISTLGDYILKTTQEAVSYTVTRPFLWYSFAGTDPMEDKSGNGLTAEAVGSPNVGEGKATLSDGNVLKLPSGLTKHMKNYTATGWVYMTAPTSGSRLFDIGRKAQASAFAHAGTDKVSSGYKNSNTKTADANGLQLGKWTHIAASYKNGTLSVYVDGKRVSTATNSDPSPNMINDVFNPNGNYLGRTQWYFIDQNRASNPDINAEIADFRLYSEAISDTEIARLARVPKLKAINVDTGAEISSKNITVPQAYAGVAADQIDGYEFVDMEFVSDLAGESNVIAYYRQKEALYTSFEGGTASAAVHLNFPREGAMLILAVYNSEGELIKAVCENVDALDKTVSVSADDKAVIKAFLWDKNMAPIELEK